MFLVESALPVLHVVHRHGCGGSSGCCHWHGRSERREAGEALALIRRQKLGRFSDCFDEGDALIGAELGDIAHFGFDFLEVGLVGFGQGPQLLLGLLDRAIRCALGKQRLVFDFVERTCCSVVSVMCSG